MSQESEMHFMVFNYTSASGRDDAYEYTVPCRQTLRELSNDVMFSLDSDLVSRPLLLMNSAKHGH